ncbi:MAG: CPBP family intramembrane metalloprotease [Clostridia bacterium]|nr:CPBP family intramembrane metalloprotease [Clostridia bacterium]
MKHPIRETAMIREARTGGRGFSLGVECMIFLGVFFVGQMLSAIPVALATVIWIFTGNFNDMFASEQGLDQIMGKMPDWLILVQLFATVLPIIVSVLFCRWFEKRSPASMGLRRGGVWKEYLVGVAIGVVMISLCVGLGAVLGVIRLELTAFSFGTWILFLLGFLIQGASEEILCRGYMMLSMARKNPIWLAVVSNAVMFSLLHVFNPGIGVLPLLNIALFGAFISVYVLKRGNLWGACAIHSFWNFFQGNVFGINVSGTAAGASPLSATVSEGMSWLSGGGFGIEGGVITTVVSATALLLAIFVMPSNQREVVREENFI